MKKNTNNSYLSSHNRLITAIGLDNLVVVETNDAVLVANKADSQEVKDIVKSLKEKNIPQGVEHQKCFRPWGTYESLVKEKKLASKIN